MSRTRLKVCCISNAEEAFLAVHAGADAVGLVARMPSGPGVISDEAIREIAAGVPPPVASFLLTAETDADAIIGHHERTGTAVIQIVDHIDLSHYAAIRRALPSIKLVQAVHVENESSIDYAIEAAGYADALLLDSGRPNAGVKILGGTGAAHDWSISRRIVLKSRVPVFLAGGINEDNVIDAISKVRPFGIDLCSGVRTEGRLDIAKLNRLIQNIKTADAL